MVSNKEFLKNDTKKFIEDNPSSFPFISKYWDIEILEENEFLDEFVEFGAFETKNSNSQPFYKPFSKIIDITKA